MDSFKLFLPPQSVSSFSSSAHEVNMKYHIANDSVGVDNVTEFFNRKFG